MAVVFRKDEKYFCYGERTTHTGVHYKFEWVEDLQRATVFYINPSHRLRHDELKGAEVLEAKETRTVTLI